MGVLLSGRSATGLSPTRTGTGFGEAMSHGTAVLLP